MKETIEEFLDRAYLDFSNKLALVWPTVKLKKATASSKNKPERWTIEKAKAYIKILEEKNDK